MPPTTLELYLVRHAVAADRGPRFPDDRLRPLTPGGVDSWPKMSKEAVAAELMARAARALDRNEAAAE